MIRLADPVYSIKIGEKDFDIVRSLINERFGEQLITINNCEYQEERVRLKDNFEGHLQRARRKGITDAAELSEKVIEALEHTPMGRLAACDLWVESSVGQTAKRLWYLWIDLERKAIVAESDKCGEYYDMGI